MLTSLYGEINLVFKRSSEANLRAVSSTKTWSPSTNLRSTKGEDFSFSSFDLSTIGIGTELTLQSKNNVIKHQFIMIISEKPIFRIAKGVKEKL